MDIEAQTIREHDERGRLKAAGFTWTDFKRDQVKRRNNIASLSSMLGMVALIAAFVCLVTPGPFHPYTSALAPWILAVAAALYFLWWFIRPRGRDLTPYTYLRTVIFTADDRVLFRRDEGQDFIEPKLTRKGARGETKTPIRVSNIASIQAEAGRSNGSMWDGPFKIGRFNSFLFWQVRVYLVDGQSVALFSALPDGEDAAIAAQNLTQALEEIRYG
jgi:hypothetical protein